jgi:enhancer of mRNA-decapping protein 3
MSGPAQSIPYTQSIPQGHQIHQSHQIRAHAPHSNPAVLPHPRRSTHEPFVDPAILSMGKKSSVAPTHNLQAAAPPLEAPATPIIPFPSLPTTAAPTVPTDTTPLVRPFKVRPVRKPSAATLEGPFSSLDIADAEEQDSDENKASLHTVRRTSINKTRTGKPMDEPAVQAPLRNDEGKKTRRGGKARKKEVAAQERRNGGDFQSSPDAVRKKYVLQNNHSGM